MIDFTQYKRSDYTQLKKELITKHNEAKYTDRDEDKAKEIAKDLRSLELFMMQV
ncbi:hypothetical protein [Dysgonomonas mossii]|uniref:hypothetical protein n=1 Tax=Dysgonomonas mossii TaxID=163665 RepID=UPI003995D20B